MTPNKQKKLILIKPTGNHSNRLLQNLHFEVFCIEHNIQYHNPTFNDLADYFAEPCSAETNQFLKAIQIDLLGNLFRHSRVIKKVLSVVWIISKLGILKFVRFDKTLDESENEKKLLEAFDKSDIVYAAGWRFRVSHLTEKYNSEMADKYALKESLYKNNKLVKELNELKLHNYTLVGIHIRRGDYKKWNKGIYFFNDNVYIEYIESISKQLFRQGKDKHKFILFSNEDLNIQESENILISKENWYIDHHLMSSCNYLIGPPSTFTLWASYIGNVKIFHIFDKKENIDLSLL